jgi:hypothetical protein
MMERPQDQQSERELILNTIAVEARRKADWQQHAAQLMAAYNITLTDVEEYIKKHGPLVKPLLLGIDIAASPSPALKDALKFMREMRGATNIPASEQTIKVARAWDEQKGFIPGSSELILKFARANNPFEKFILFVKLIIKFICSPNRTEMAHQKPGVDRKLSHSVYHELIAVVLTFITIYLVFPYLPGIIFRQSITNTLEFTFYWAIFKYVVFPTFFLFAFAAVTFSLWREDKETRKISISK